MTQKRRYQLVVASAGALAGATIDGLVAQKSGALGGAAIGGAIGTIVARTMMAMLAPAGDGAGLQKPSFNVAA
jgi:hypothetical protein